MAGLADRPYAGILNLIATSDPAPGGGSSAALAAALGGALLEMASSIELSRERPDERVPEDTAKRARRLRELATELADRDLSSYAPVLEARRLPESDPARESRIEAALVDASRPPLEVAEAAAEAAELGAIVTAAANRAVRGDALAGVLIAEAATVAAAALVEINLEGIEGPDLARAREARRRAQAAREDALSTLPRG